MKKPANGSWRVWIEGCRCRSAPATGILNLPGHLVIGEDHVMPVQVIRVHWMAVPDISATKASDLHLHGAVCDADAESVSDLRFHAPTIASA